MASQKPNNSVKILKFEEKARILAWAEKEMLMKEIGSCTG